MWIDMPQTRLDGLLAKGWIITSKGYLEPPEKELPPTLQLYVVRAHNSSLFKIGVTRDLQGRKSGLQTGSSLKLEIICHVEIDSPTMETKAHWLLRRRHSHGEWFDLGEDAEPFARAVQVCHSMPLLLDIFRAIR
jgi:hypothetical protein